MDETRTKCPRRSELKLGQEVWRESVCFLLLVVRRMCICVSVSGHCDSEVVATMAQWFDQKIGSGLLLCCIFKQIKNKISIKLFK